MKSMTAFARTQHTAEWGRFHWEVRSVNQRFLDLTFKLPENYHYLEPALREQIKACITRGKIDLSLTLEPTELAPEMDVNQAVLQPLVKAVNEVQLHLMEATHVNPLEILQWPGVLHSKPASSSVVKTVESDLLSGFAQALTELNQHRQREGRALKQLILQRCQSIKTLTQQAQTLLPEIIQNQTTLLRQRARTLVSELDENRFNQELAVLAQKLDVQEELDRLQTHLLEVTHTLDHHQPIGRRLDFLMQELNREANTLGSKSADSRTSNISVELKVLIEQIREQVQNIE
ncbi:MAG: YicC family protein [Thiotrichales bacterium]|nr:YicC family protein [Thiotrichales bacterium]